MISALIEIGFGDGYYKLPKGLFGDSQHRRYVETISSVEERLNPGKITMISQYSVLFYAYKTPPYITPDPESSRHQLKEGDVAILATDGLWDLISSESAAEIVLRGLMDGATNLAQYLLRQVMQEKKPGDDVTVLILHVHSSP